MQFKNIILSLAATLALAQAAVVSQRSTPIVDAATCWDKATTSIGETPEIQTTEMKNCSICFLKTYDLEYECVKFLLDPMAGENSTEIPETLAFEDLPVKAKDCYTKAFNECDPAEELKKMDTWTG